MLFLSGADPEIFYGGGPLAIGVCQLSLGRKPAAGEKNFMLPILPYVHCSALLEEEMNPIPPFHQPHTPYISRHVFHFSMHETCLYIVAGTIGPAVNRVAIAQSL